MPLTEWERLFKVILANIKSQSKIALAVASSGIAANRKAVETIVRKLRDIRQNDQSMGGVTVHSCSDFRQILPVIPRGTRADGVRACIKSSRL